MSNDSTIRLSRRSALGLLAVTPIAMSITGCGGSGGGNTSNRRSAAYTWVGTMLTTISNGSLGPPMVARAIGMVTTAMFDAWAAYDSVAVATRLGDNLRRPVGERTLANKEKAISYAAFRVLLDLYPAQTTAINTAMSDLGYDPADASTNPATPQGIGNLVAADMLAFRHDDGSNQLNGYADTTGYVPVNTPTNVVDPSQWQQLQFANGASPGFIAPHWRNVVPFALTATSAIRPPDPTPFGSPTYMNNLDHVIDLLAGLDDKKKVIAEYWADGPKTVLPPGHWQVFGQFISQRDGHTLAQDVQMFFMLGNGVFDSGIACWECKRFFNTSRPFTAIRHFKAGQQIPSFLGPGNGVGLDDGANWYPYQSRNFITPPFAEYTSGHSTFSSCSAELLKRFTGSDHFGHSVTLPAGWSVFDPGVPAAPVTLSWSTFTDAAVEAGASRLYGGIHFAPGNDEGLRCGKLVAEQVWEKCQTYIRGTAPHIRA